MQTFSDCTTDVLFNALFHVLVHRCQAQVLVEVLRSKSAAAFVPAGKSITATKLRQKGGRDGFDARLRVAMCLSDLCCGIHKSEARANDPYLQLSNEDGVIFSHVVSTTFSGVVQKCLWDGEEAILRPGKSANGTHGLQASPNRCNEVIKRWCCAAVMPHVPAALEIIENAMRREGADVLNVDHQDPVPFRWKLQFCPPRPNRGWESNKWTVSAHQAQVAATRPTELSPAQLRHSLELLAMKMTLLWQVNELVKSAVATDRSQGRKHSKQMSTTVGQLLNLLEEVNQCSHAIRTLGDKLLKQS